MLHDCVFQITTASGCVSHMNKSEFMWPLLLQVNLRHIAVFFVTMSFTFWSHLLQSKFTLHPFVNHTHSNKPTNCPILTKFGCGDAVGLASGIARMEQSSTFCREACNGPYPLSPLQTGEHNSTGVLYF